MKSEQKPTFCQALKRVLGVVVSACALVTLAPALAVIALLIRIDSARPAIYVQLRAGQGRREFRLYKFRTMANDADARLADVLPLNVHARKSGDVRLYKIPNDPRVTRFGRVLRACSLDELPQLVNALKGDMSLVGPRPLMLMEDAHVAGCALRRATVRPGLTGLWQVRSRNELPSEEMMRLDCADVDRWSLGWDLQLLMQTLPAMFQRQEAS